MNITRRPFLQAPSHLFPRKSIPLIQCFIRYRSNATTSRPVPPPIPFVPDLPTFFRLIGRNMSEHVSKFSSWESFFQMPSEDFRTIGVEPARSRRYLLAWRERYRQGKWGPGGDFTDVTDDGAAYLKVVEIPRPTGQTSPATAIQSENTMRIITNVPMGGDVPSKDEVIPVKFYEIGEETMKIQGPGATPVKGAEGQMARVTSMDRLWEIKRGKKKDGGERRRKEVRAKRAAEERKKARDAAGAI